MSMIVVLVVVAIIICVTILLSLNYKYDQALVCPNCQIDFTTDIYLLYGNSLVACPFCYHWMLVQQVRDRYIVKKFI